MEIIQDFIPLGNINRPERTNSMEFITIHNTGNTKIGADADNHIGYLKNLKEKTSWHYTVDDKCICQHLPDNECAFHTGDGFGLKSGNRRSIGIEICMNPDCDLLKATENAVKLTRYLMKKYNIPITNVVQHNKWSGKNCPQMIRAGKPYDWNTFINKVMEVEKMDGIKDIDTALKVLVDKKIINTPDYWKGAIEYVKYQKELILAMANYIIKEG